MIAYASIHKFDYMLCQLTTMNNKIKTTAHFIKSLLTVSIFVFLFTAGNSCQKKKVYTVGIINFVPALEENVRGLKKGMTELGYVEGENINYIYDDSNRDNDSLEKIARDLVDADVDIIVPVTTPATLVAKKVTADVKIPVVFMTVTDPVGAGIISSLKQPEGNIAGISFGIQEEKRVEWLKKIAPEIKNIYVPFNPDDKSPVLALSKIESVIKSLGVNLITRKTGNQKELDYAVKNIPSDADAVLLLPDGFLSTRIDELIQLAIERRLPVSGANIDVVKNHEALMSFGFDQQLCGKKAARLVVQIIKGAKPSDLPIETPEFALAINLKVAKKINLEIPDNILRQANILVR